MKKGLQKTLFVLAATIAGISSSYAAAPVISGLPDIQIGDQEQNTPSDNNLFIYTGAFIFDDHVSDADSTVSELLWSFDELDLEVGAPGASTDKWYSVNGKESLHQGDAASLAGEGDHLNPASANELRQPGNGGQAAADFRDIVHSPGTGSGPFPTPTADHSMGRALAFYVSDTTNVTSDVIYVKTVDNAFDDKSDSYIPIVENTSFPTGADSAWVKTSSVTGQATAEHDTAQAELEIHVQNNSTVGRFAGWLEKQPVDDPSGAHLKISDIGGAGKIVRAKYHIYATNLSNGVPAVSEIPNFNVRLNYRFGYSNVLFNGHNVPGDGDAAVLNDLAPSTDPNDPSIYRVDMDVPELPYYSTVAAQDEGLQRYFQAFSETGQAQFGKLVLKESSLGVYEANLGDNSKIIKTYETTADFADARISWVLRKLTRGGTLADTHGASYNGLTGVTTNPSNGSVSAVNFAELDVNMSPGGVAGAEVYTSGVPDSQIGIAGLDWLVGAAEDDDLTKRARVSANKVYSIRFYATATGASSANALLRFRARTVKFSWTQRLEIGGAWNQAITANNITDPATLDRPGHVAARQYLPGTGGWTQPYDLLMVSPMVGDNIAADYPDLSAQAGPGVNGPVSGLSRRDIFPGIDILDTLSGDYFTAGTSDKGERGYVKVSKIEIREFDLVDDGD